MIEVLKSPNETVTIRVPIDVLLANGGEGVLNDLDRCRYLHRQYRPTDSTIVDGEMPLVEGRVLNDSNLERSR